MSEKGGLASIEKCPWCDYRSCLLGLTAHALGVHRKNLLAWACRRSPRHEHRFSRGRTEVRYVVIPGGRRGREKPKRREPKKSRREAGVTLLRSEA